MLVGSAAGIVRTLSVEVVAGRGCILTVPMVPLSGSAYEGACARTFV
jgi:hypothetical protein